MCYVGSLCHFQIDEIVYYSKMAYRCLSTEHWTQALVFLISRVWVRVSLVTLVSL